MKQRSRGFTLLELMTVIVIAGILVGLGWPAMTDFVRNARMTSAANDFMAALHMARSEAVKRRSQVVVCTSNNALSAAPACTSSANLTGWIVFVDSNGNGQWDAAWTFDDVDGDGRQDVLELDGPDADTVWTAGQLDEDLDNDGNQDVAEADVAEVLLAQHAPLDAGITSRGSTNPLRIAYADTGFATAGADSDIVFCDLRGNVPSAGDLSAARGISVAATGRAGVTRDTAQLDTMIERVGGTIGGCGG